MTNVLKITPLISKSVKIVDWHIITYKGHL